MAAAAPIAFSRKPAPLETAWMFCRGRHLLVCAYLILSFGWIGLMFAPSGFIYLAVTSVTLFPMLAISAAIIDARAAERLAFASLLPRVGSAKWLVLGPMCAAGALLVAASVVVARRPPLLGLAMLGCCFWAVSIGRWLSRRWWALTAIPALLVGPCATLFALRSGGMGAAAAVSMGLAALGFFLSPGVRRNAAGASAIAGMDRRVGPRASVSTVGAPVPAFVSALRLWRIGASHVMRWVIIACVMTAVIWFALMPDVLGYHQAFFIISLGAAMAIGQSSKAGRHEFLSALPMTRARLFAGSVLPWVVPLLVIPVVLLVRLYLESPNGDGPLARVVRDPDGFEARHLRGPWALVQPDWARGRSPAELWAPLVAAMRAHILRMALFALAFLASFSAAWTLSERKVRRVAVLPRWTVYLLPLPVYYGSTLPAMLLHRPQSLWLMALLALDTALIWFLVWQLPPTPAAMRRGTR